METFCNQPNLEFVNYLIRIFLYPKDPFSTNGCIWESRWTRHQVLIWINASYLTCIADLHYKSARAYLTVLGLEWLRSSNSSSLGWEKPNLPLFCIRCELNGMWDTSMAIGVMETTYVADERD